MRSIRIEWADLNRFEFDYDLTLAAFFLNADGHIYGRYGSRDASDPDGRNSIAGLRYALQAALKAHRDYTNSNTRKSAAQRKSLHITDYPAGRQMAAKSCIHCHQIYEIRRKARQKSGQWSRDELWGYPLPENVGVVLDVDQGDRVKSVLPDSPAARAGIAPGDELQRVAGAPIASIADFQYALHRAPFQGKIAVTWQKRGNRRTGTLVLDKGWKKTNITWRPSVLDLLPAVGLFGTGLTAAEKQKLGLKADRLAFRQSDRVHPYAREAGVRAGDVIIGIDNKTLSMGMFEFLGDIRKNYLIGDRVTLNIFRAGRRVDLPMTLK